MAGGTACLLVLLLTAGAAAQAAQLDTLPLQNAPAPMTAAEGASTVVADSATQRELAATPDYSALPQEQTAAPSKQAAGSVVEASLCSAEATATSHQQSNCGDPTAPAPVHIAAPPAQPLDTGDRSLDTAELLELAGVTDAMAQHISQRASTGSSYQWPGSSVSSQLHKLMGTQHSSSSSSSSPAGSRHRKLLIYYGPQATHGFLLSYTLSFRFNTSSGNGNAAVLANPATNPASLTANNFKSAVQTAVGRLVPAPGANVLPPVVSQVTPGNPLTMTLGMYLQTEAAMRAAAAGTGTPPDDLMAAVDEAMTQVQALKLALDDAAVTSSYALTDIAVQRSSNNDANIQACAEFVDRGRSWQGVGDLSTTAIAALIVIPVAVGLAAGLRIMFVIRARRRAAAAAAAAAATNPATSPAITIGAMKMGPTAAAASALQEPAMGVPYNGSYCSAEHRASSPPAVVSPFAACQSSFVHAAPAVGTAAAPGQGVQYGSYRAAYGNAGYYTGAAAVQGPYGPASSAPAY